MRHLPPIIFFLFLFCWQSNASHAQTVVNPPEKYQPSITKLQEWIGKEMEIKGIPSIGIVLVDDQQIVWSKGFGFADEAKTHMADANTVYRVGSVSKPVTALVLMMLMEMGLVDLDAPVQKYLPELRPTNPYEKQYTVRQLLAHRSGLVRESPVGNYFDDSGASLKDMVLSLNKTELVYEPGSKSSYSNAGLATVGYLMEKITDTPFDQLMTKRLLKPLQMDNSSYKQTKRIHEKMPAALMWTYDGREFPAPTFQLAMAPAGELHSSPNDMGKLLKFLFAHGKSDQARLLKKQSIQDMWVPRFAKKGEADFGIGFHVSKFSKYKSVRHGGAIYGFSTEFIALPEQKLGVVVMSSRDVSNGFTKQVADTALNTMLAVKQGKAPPALSNSEPVERSFAKKVTGLYCHDSGNLELEEQLGKLYIWPPHNGTRLEIRKLGKKLIVDDAMSTRQDIKITEKKVVFRGKEYVRKELTKPSACPKKWQGLIGEYGWDHNTLYILEKDNQLYALIEWVFLYPLTEKSENVFEFPDYGLYHGHDMIFTRKNGKAVSVEAGSVVFPRRVLKGENSLFTIDPIKPLATLRKQALRSTPPKEAKKPRKSDLVDISALDPTIKMDIRYASENNFLKTPFYTSAKAFMQKPAAEALVRVHKNLAKEGYGLLIHDAYRPWHVTKMFWDATPEKYKLFVADPSAGSRHNRGCAVDLTLYDLKTGKPVKMVAGFDEFSDRAYAFYIGGTSLQRWHRELLRKSMEAEGFEVYHAEWWHFDYQDWRDYPIANLTFEEILEKNQGR